MSSVKQVKNFDFGYVFIIYIFRIGSSYKQNLWNKKFLTTFIVQTEGVPGNSPMDRKITLHSRIPISLTS